MIKYFTLSYLIVEREREREKEGERERDRERETERERVIATECMLSLKYNKDAGGRA